jgi:cobalt/nickel transport system permease protein
MHIPDNFLATPVWAALDAVSIAAVGVTVQRAGRDLPDTRIPLLGVMGAFVFAAQMINFPVGAGTSGHLVGGALLASTLGPAPAVLVMTTILTIQAFVFQDGGVLALGANVFNMAVAGVLCGYLPIRLLSAERPLAIFSGGFLSVLVSGSLALTELLISGVRMPRALLLTSFGLFAVNALIEGAITVSVVQALGKLNPDFVRKPAASAQGRTLAVFGAASLFLALAGFMLASSAPDAIQNLGRTFGISTQTPLQTPMANYTAGNFESAWLRRATAGLTGLLLIWAICAAGARAIARRRSA